MCARGLGSRKEGRGLSHGQVFKGFQVEGTAPETEFNNSEHGVKTNV